MDLEFLDRIDREQKYKAHIMRHITGVESAFNRNILPLKGQFGDKVDNAIDLCGQVIPLHDLSKLSSFEFDAYRKKNFPTDAEKQDPNTLTEIEKAVEHHYSVNPHHPYFWCQGGTKRDMPLQYILEMLCDWSAVSETEGGSVVEYWDVHADRERNAMTYETLAQVNLWIDLLFREPGRKF